MGFSPRRVCFLLFFSPSARPPSAPLFGRVVDWMTRRLSACRQIFLMIFVQAMLRSIWARCLRVSVFVSMCVRGFFYAPVSAKLIIYIYIYLVVVESASRPPRSSSRCWTRFFQLCAAYSDFTVLSHFNHRLHHHHHHCQSSVTSLDNLCIMCTI